MALTPEDVVNKRFQQTKFREGYDQDEVDDFLDEIVVELRRLIAENEELRRALDEATKGAPAPATSPQVEAPTETPADQTQAPSAPAQAPAAAAPAPQAMPAQIDDLANVQDDPSTPENEAETSNSLLLLARRLHDEHVADGARRRDELIAEAESRAQQLLSEAELNAKNITSEGQARAAQIVADAERRERETVGRAEEQKQKIEARIEELRIFEREYRNELRAFIEGQLNDLNKQASNVEPQGPVAQQP